MCNIYIIDFKDGMGFLSFFFVDHCSVDVEKLKKWEKSFSSMLESAGESVSTGDREPPGSRFIYQI